MTKIQDILTSNQDYKTISAFFYAREIRFLNDRSPLFVSVVALLDAGLLERQPFAIIRQEEQVDGKNYDIYQELMSLYKTTFPEEAEYADAVLHMHKLVLQLAYHPVDNSQYTWEFAVNKNNQGRQNHKLNYSVFENEENRKNFTIGAQHQTVADGYRIKKTMLPLFVAMTNKIINHHGKSTTVSEEPKKRARRTSSKKKTTAEAAE